MPPSASVHVPQTPHALQLPPLREESRKDYTSEELLENIEA